MPAEKGGLLMKTFGRIALLLLALLLLLPASALAKDLDEIQNYGVSVQLREDGTMDLTYHLDWKVLDDQAEGPLEWVLIGIPNQHADSFAAISANIRSVSLSTASGSYAKVVFDRKYKAGETVSFDFSFHQSYMYVIEGDTVRFSLTPGWFDKIEVKNAVVRWNVAGVSDANATVTEEDYLYWKTALRKGERLRAEVTYPKAYFMELDTAKQATKAASSGDDDNDWVYGLVGLGITVGVILWIRNIFRDGYGGGSGFGGGGHHHTVIVSRSSGCVRSSCACASCACACACACAGGGRAGCSKKDFYRGPGENAPTHSDDVFPLLFEALKNTK